MTPENFFLVMIAVAAAGGLVLLLLSIRQILRRGETEVGGADFRGWVGRVTAVARSTLAEGIRKRIAIVFIVVVLVTVPFLAVTATGDGTIRGRVQMFIGYTFGITTFVLALLTINFAARSLSSEIASRQILSLVSKPIPRWQIVTGKWLGVTILNVFLVAFAAAGAYAGVRYILWSFHREMHHELVTRASLTDDQAGKCLNAIESISGPGAEGVDSPIIPAIAAALGMTNEKVTDMLIALPYVTRENLRRLDQVRRQVLVARASVEPDYQDIHPEAKTRFAEMLKKKQEEGAPQELKNLPNDQLYRSIVRELESRERRIPPGEAKRWLLKGPAAESGKEALLTVRFKLEGTSGAVTTPDGAVFEEDTVLGLWVIGDPNSAAACFWPDPPTPQHMGSHVEFEVPGSVVKPDGTIELRFKNGDPRRFTATLATKNGLEVLYRVGGFEGNLLRASLLTLLPLVFLAAVGVFFSTFCTFPVAQLVTLVIYAAGTTGGFLYESLGITEDYMPENPNRIDSIRRDVGSVLIDTLALGQIDPAQRLVEGRLIAWREIGTDAARTVLLRSSVFLLLGIYIFRRKELAAVIV